MGETAKIAEPISGDKLYQRRARKALPLLVRQAQVRKTIYYSDLASELRMPNPRNLNYPLGSIGQALMNLSDEWNEDIPAIQCLVINKRNRLPGEGVGWFITKRNDFEKLPLETQQELVWAELHKVFQYPKWPVVLKKLGLSADYGQIVEEAKRFRAGGESERHRRLKEYVAGHPEVLHLPAKVGKGRVEFALPSGDRVDVLFQDGDVWHAVEVKSAVSDAADVARGIFQCVKYRAVIKAFQATEGLPQSVRTRLVLEGLFPAALTQMRQILGVEVLTRISPG